MMSPSIPYSPDARRSCSSQSWARTGACRRRTRPRIRDIPSCDCRKPFKPFDRSSTLEDHGCEEHLYSRFTYDRDSWHASVTLDACAFVGSRVSLIDFLGLPLPLASSGRTPITRVFSFPRETAGTKEAAVLSLHLGAEYVNGIHVHVSFIIKQPARPTFAPPVVKVKQIYICG